MNSATSVKRSHKNSTDSKQPPIMTPISRRRANKPTPFAALCWLAVVAAQVAQTVQVHDQPQQEPAAIKPKPTRLELKFQSELDNSKIFKRPGEQQVFKCQVRLAPAAGAGGQQARARLKSSSSWLTDESAAEFAYASSDWSVWDGVALAPALAPLKLNVSQLTIEWLKNGLPLDVALGNGASGEQISVVNVTLKTQHQQQQSRTFDKMSRGQAQKPRVEIKNTLNGQQLKLTSRLRVSQMRAGDSGLFQCVARARFSLHDDGHSSSELVEQSLESANAHLIVGPGAPDQSDLIDATKSGENGRPGPVPPDDAVAPARPFEQQQGRHSSGGPSLQSDGEGPAQFEPQPRQRGSTSATTTTSLFEDDEDLFGLNSSELISGSQSANDNEQEQQIIGSDTTNNDLNGLSVGVGRQKSEEQQQQQWHAEAHLDWILDGSAGDEDGGASDNDDQSGLSSQRPPLSRRRPQPGGRHKIDDRAQQQEDGGGPRSLVSEPSEDSSTFLPPRVHSSANEAPPAPFNHRRPADGAEDSSALPGGRWASEVASEHTHASAHSKLAKLVHKIVPESSCYTGAGELYRGSAALSADQRVCLNWLQVRASLAGRAWDAAASRLKLQQQQQQQQQHRWPKQVRENQTTTTTTTTIATADYLSGSSLSAALAPTLDDHNHCRNPNGDPRGPWCFVAYSEALDGVILTPRPPPPPPQSPFGPKKVITHRHRVVRVGLPLSGGASAPPLLAVVRPCAQIVSCSEYLWLYVVAPSLGLIVLLTCLASLAVRSVRKSRCNAIFSTAAYQRQPLKCTGSSPGGAGPLSLGLGKLLASRRPSRKRLVSTKADDAPRSLCCGLGRESTTRGQHHAATRKTPSYLDDDIFEIVDDIDWSDGRTAAGAASQATTMSPKSSESFNLHSTASESSSTSPRRTSANTNANEALRGDWQTRMAHSKSTNPVFSEQALDLQLSQRQQRAALLAASSRHNGAAGQNKMSKSKSQAGPMFATLRCHVRNTHQKRLAADSSCSSSSGRRGGGGGELSQLQPQAKKSSSFIEHQCSNGEAQQNKQRGANCDWVRPAVGNSSSIHSDLSSTRTGHLISCAASSCGSNGSSNALASNNHNNDTPAADSERLTLASELPRLDASSVSLAYETEAIYEGKFSQVLKAYHRQNELDLTQATGRIGAQVAVCSLKQQAAMDESVYYASELRVHNLNHLNILKLLGRVQSSELADAMGDQAPQTTTSGDLIEAGDVVGRARCSLVYDMAHLIDLSDWLKEQCKDAIVAQDDEISGDLSLRHNLTCVAKQVALALDYLHDKNIVYKDLACRNCFMDVTRMLVKLASFNVEPEFVSQEESPAYGHLGVPPPVPSGGNNTIQNSEDNSKQELLSKKLSLKSMVRPKYLLDYYVIDSRPSECQLLPLSWIPLESILFNKFNKQTDIWSFGCLLYELFSLGEVAYFGYSSKQVIDSVRSNMMPPQPLLCPNGIYKLMCKCLSDIPTLRPDIKHVYEQLNLYSGQCSSFLNHHLCII